MGHLRVRGQPAVELAVFLKALACNCKRYLRYVQNPVRQVQNRGKETILLVFYLKKVKLFLQNWCYVTKMALGYNRAA